MNEVRLNPPAPNKELPFLVMNMFSFASDEDARNYEREINKWWPDLHLFVGRMTGEVSEKYTHCIVWLYRDFEEHKRNLEDYAASLKDSKNPIGDWPGYTFEHAYVCRVVNHRDPILLEHGIDEWARRLHESIREAKLPNPEKVAAWTQTIGAKLERDWGREALKRSKWE